MIEKGTAGYNNVEVNLPPAGELLPSPDTAYLLPIVGAEVVRATNWEAPSGAPDGGTEKFFRNEDEEERGDR